MALEDIATRRPEEREDRIAYRSATTMNAQAEASNAQGKYAQAQPLYEKALESRRRLLTDDNPETAQSYNNLGANVVALGNYAQAGALLRKALEIRRRLLTDDHPDTAESYNNVAFNLNKEGKYAEALPLLEKALDIRSRLLGDSHADTAQSENNLASNLVALGKYAQAQPLLERRSRPSDCCSRTITRTLRRPTTTWRSPSMLRASMPRPSRSTREASRFSVVCLQTTTPSPQPATTT